MFKLSVSILKMDSLEQQYNAIEYANLLGIEYIETTPNKNPMVTAKYSSIQSILPDINYNIFETIESCDRALQEESLSKTYQMCRKYNIKNVVFGCPKYRNISNEAELENAIYFFIALSNNFGMNISIEPVSSKYGTNFLTNTLDAIDFIRRNRLERTCSINLDLGNCIENNDDLNAILTEENIKYINHIHVSAPSLSDSIIQYRDYYLEAISKLKELKYDKFISLESLSDNITQEIEHFVNLFKEED